MVIMMIVNKTQENGRITLVPEGRLDAVTSQHFQNDLIEALEAAKEVSLDFSKLTYVSSAGLRVLLIGQKTAKTKNAEYTLFNVSAEIMEVLEMTGFTDMLTIK